MQADRACFGKGAVVDQLACDEVGNDFVNPGLTFLRIGEA